MPSNRSSRGLIVTACRAIGVLLAIYVTVAYLVLPKAWQDYAERRPSFDDSPRITLTGDQHPGDPVNVALIGSTDEITQAMRAARWFVADSLGLRSDIEIAVDTVLQRPYDQAPVSNLFLFGRKEDLAFEQPASNDPRQRHHVRFWRTPQSDTDGRSIWVGSASYDTSVGLSHTTGQVTHHITADVDQERDKVLQDLELAGELNEQFTVTDFHAERSGRNGGGDPWMTDGALAVGVLRGY